MAKKANNLALVGKWAFIIGLALAIIAGLIQGVYTIPSLILILVILGLIVGFLNIAEKDTVKLLIAIIALMMVGGITLSAIPTINIYLEAILANILIFASGAGLVVAIKAIIETTKK
tara:strand:+ start:1384 stop:1734 length:351 start_codon:yes stop_codon:yes gene_type:complete